MRASTLFARVFQAVGTSSALLLSTASFAQTTPAVTNTEPVAINTPTAKPEAGMLATLSDEFQTGLKQGQWFVALNGLSQHFDVAPSYAAQGINQRNWGLGLQYDLPRAPGRNWHWMFNGGGYHDSSNGTAVYLGGAWMVDVIRRQPWQAQLGLQAGIFHSERYNGGRVFVALMPVANIGHDNVSLNIAVAPRIPQIIDAGVVFFQLKVKL